MKDTSCGVGLLLATALTQLLPSNAGAVLLNLTDDSHVSSSAPKSNYGTSGNLHVTASSTGFLKFDLSTLPAGGASNEVIKATLTVFISKVTVPGEIDAKRVTAGPWDEAHIIAANAPPLGGPTEDSAPNVTDAKSFLTFNVTALVRDWVGNVLANNGIALVAVGSAAVIFNSKENTGTGHPATLDIAVATPCAGNDAQDRMVKVGTACVDAYEASVWNTPAGGVQYGVTSIDGDGIHVDYPCQPDGSDCATIFARSVAAVIPSTGITWLQAQQACANSGKRLLRNAEWQTAASGTPFTGTDNGTTDCNNTWAPTCALDPFSCPPTRTGSRSNCVSRVGIFDIVGNVAEYVEEWDSGQPVLRGGDYAEETAGLLAWRGVDANVGDFPFGFRCGR